MKNSKILKKITGLMLCAVVIAAGLWVAADQASAYSRTGNGDPYRYNSSPIYLENSGTGIKSYAEAYVVGSDHLVQTNKFGRGVHVDALSVKYDTYFTKKYSVASKYTRADNVQNLYNLWTSVYGNSVSMSWPSNAEYYAAEGEKLYVIDYTADYVYYWSPGYKSFSGNSMYNCDKNVVLESHPAGFYKIKRDYVWLDIHGREELSTKKAASAGTAQAVYEVLPVFQKPGIENNSMCYAYPQNTEINIISATPIKGEDGETYYKAQIKGNTAVKYMECGYYTVYVKSKHINFYNKKVKVPAGYSKAVVKDVPKGYAPSIYLSSDGSKDSKITCYMSNGTKMKVYPKKSNSKYACIWHNNGYAYISVKYLQYYVDEIVIKDVVNGKYILSWGKVPVKVNVSYKLGDKTVGNTISYAANKESITVGNGKNESLLMNSGIEMTAEVPGSGIKATKKLYYPTAPFTLLFRSIDNNTATFSGFSNNVKTNGPVLEYSTNKNFKNAKKVYPKSNFYTVKGLKKNTTYYFRYYNTLKVQTEKGKKLMKGKYSNVIKKKTTNITISKPVLRTVKGGKKNVTLKWKITSKKASKTEIMIATNKNFTKNVKKSELNKKFTEYTWPYLKAKTTYYVKIRTEYYDRSTKNTYYSGWTTLKKFKTK